MAAVARVPDDPVLEDLEAAGRRVAALERALERACEDRDQLIQDALYDGAGTPQRIARAAGVTTERVRRLVRCRLPRRF
jgi:hypothetical protein